MKKLISLIVAFISLFALVGCLPENTVNIEFPFEPEDVAFVEIHHTSASLYAEDVEFKSQESITALYRQLESISYKDKDSDASRLHEITSFNTDSALFLMKISEQSEEILHPLVTSHFYLDKSLF